RRGPPRASSPSDGAAAEGAGAAGADSGRWGGTYVLVVQGVSLVGVRVVEARVLGPLLLREHGGLDLEDQAAARGVPHEVGAPVGGGGDLGTEALEVGHELGRDAGDLHGRPSRPVSGPRRQAV